MYEWNYTAWVKHAQGQTLNTTEEKADGKESVLYN